MRRISLPIILCALAGLSGLRAQPSAAPSPADRWLEILEAQPANSVALTRLVESAPHESWPQIAKRLEAIPGPLGRLALADFQFRTSGDAAATLAQLDTAALDPGSLLRLGNLRAALGQNGLARKAWEAAAAKSPHDPLLLQRLAQAGVAAGDIAYAANIYRQLAQSADPTRRLEALEQLSQLLDQLGESRAAATAAIEALEMLGPTHWKFPTLAATALEKIGRLGMLEETAQRWSAADPATLRRRAALETFRGNHEAAAEALRLACQRLPAEPALAETLGLAELAAGHPDRAAEALRRARSLEPSPDRALALAEALALSGKEAAAEAEIANSGAPQETQLEHLRALGLEKPLENALRQAASNPVGHRRLAEFLLERGRLEEALDALRALPPIEAARLLKSRYFLAKAEEFARQAAQDQPIEATLLLAEILEARGLSALNELAQAAEKQDSEALDLRLVEAIRREEADEAAAKARLRAEGQRRLAHARASAQPALWLRAARWIEIMHENPAPILEEAARAFPQNLEILRALADAHESQGDPDAALEALASAQRLQPTPDLDRHIARIEKLRGNTEAASAILIRLANENPADFSLAREVAEAREAEGNAFDALRWWEKAFAIAPPHERAPLLHPILSCFSRLGLIPRALNFLENAGPKLPEGISRKEWARAALAFAREHQMLEEWSRRCQARASESPAAKLALQELGEKSQVVYNESLIEKLRQAESAQDWPRALLLARQLAHAPQASPDDQVALARLLEKAGEFSEAAAQWRFLSSRYQRSQSLLLEAADFFDRSLDSPRATKLRIAAARLGPLPPPTALSLARELPAPEAFSTLQALVQRLPEDPVHERLPYPIRMEKHPSPDPLPREKALRELGRLKIADRQALESLAGNSGTGLIWALSAAGLPSAQAARAYADQFPNEFAALALDECAFPLLLDWIAAHQPVTDRWQRVTAAAGPLFANGWTPDPSALLGFMAKAPAFARLDFAEAAAATGNFRIAAAIGVPEGLAPDREAVARLQVAKWHFQLLEVGRGLAVLADMPEPSTASLDDPFYEALRIRALLLHPTLPGIPNSPAAQALAAALAQNRDLFREAARTWLPLIDPLRESGILESWNLHTAAEDLLEIAWQEQRNRQFLDALAALRISSASPARAYQLTHLWIGRGARPEMILATAARATGLHRKSTAREILEALLRWQPGFEPAWGHLAALPGPLSDRAWEILEPVGKTLPEGLRVSLSRKLPQQQALQLLEEGQSEISQARRAEVENQAPSQPPGAEVASNRQVPPLPDTPEKVEAFLDSRPAPDELAKMAQRLADESPGLVKNLSEETAARFFPRPLHSRFLRQEIAWAQLRGSLPQLEKEWTHRAERGERLAWEGLILIGLDNDAKALPAIQRYVQFGRPSPTTLAALAQELASGKHPDALGFVLRELKAYGIPSPQLALTALKLEPDAALRESQLQTLERLARWDISWRAPLVTFFSENGNPQRAALIQNLPFGPRSSEVAP